MDSVGESLHPRNVTQVPYRYRRCLRHGFVLCVCMCMSVCVHECVCMFPIVYMHPSISLHFSFPQ